MTGTVKMKLETAYHYPIKNTLKIRQTIEKAITEMMSGNIVE